MATNLDRYKKDLEILVTVGEALEAAIKVEELSDELQSRESYKGKEDLKKLVNRFPSFNSEYQTRGIRRRKLL